MDEMINGMEELENVITMTDENGEEVNFEFIDLVSYKGTDYVVLLPIEDDQESEVVILKVEASEDEEFESYVSEENEETLMAVFEIFKERFKDDFNFAE